MKRYVFRLTLASGNTQQFELWMESVDDAWHELIETYGLLFHVRSIDLLSIGD